MTRNAPAMLSLALMLGALGPFSSSALGQSGGTAPPEKNGDSDRSSQREDRDEQRSASGGSDPDPDERSSEEVPSGSHRLNVGAGALLGRAQRISGTIEGADTGQTVLVQRSGDSGWETVARSQAAAGGAFRALWRPEHAGRFTLRAVASRGGRAGSAGGRAPSAEVTVYRPAIATLFGPGLFGGRTACGPRLATSTVGVAHRSLPCGTRIEVYYAGRRMIVPVIDRGPFVRGVAWDLTSSLAAALRFPGRGTVGTIALGR